MAQRETYLVVWARSWRNDAKGALDPETTGVETLVLACSLCRGGTHLTQ